MFSWLASFHVTVGGHQFGFVWIAVLLLLFIFFLFYAIPAVWSLVDLYRLSSRINAAKATSTPLTKGAMSDIFQPFGHFNHRWNEYAETLHEQFTNVDGEKRLLRIRATVPAEVYFNAVAVIDGRTHAEFFRHLPGILTGIGIIGTFIGLISGLQEFNLKLDDPAMLTAALDKLIYSVKEAFIASAVAIIAAMLVTFIEKALVNWNHNRLDKLVQTIDGLHEAGAGEEYLAQLVRSSEEGATHSRQLKDSLVEDLKHLLTELTERQVQATHQASAAMANQIGDSIAGSLQAPLDKIANVVEVASGKQGDAVHGMLENLMTAFMAKLEDTMGDQMKGLAAMLTESAGSMREMQAGFGRLVSELSQAGDNASRSMSDQLANMMAEAEARQARMAEALDRAVASMQGQISGGQEEMQQRLGDAIAGIKDTVGQMMADMAEQRRHLAASGDEEAQRLREAMTSLLDEVRSASQQTANRYGDELSATLAKVQSALDTTLGSLSDSQRANDERSQQLLETLDARLTVLIDSSKGAADSLRENIGRLNQTSMEAINGMNRGAETMRKAAEGFATAGDTVTGAVAKGGELFERVSTVAKGLEATAGTMRDTVAAYAQTRGSLEAMAETLRTTVQEADQRAGLSGTLVTDMERLVARFSESQTQAREYLDEITSVLGRAFDDFSKSTTTSLDKSRSDFDVSLSKAVGMLDSEIQELTEVLENFRVRVSN